MGSNQSKLFELEMKYPCEHCKKIIEHNARILRCTRCNKVWHYNCAVKCGIAKTGICPDHHIRTFNIGMPIASQIK